MSVTRFGFRRVPFAGRPQLIRLAWDRSVKELKEGEELPKPVSLLRESLSTMLTFFVSLWTFFRSRLRFHRNPGFE